MTSVQELPMTKVLEMAQARMKLLEYDRVRSKKYYNEHRESKLAYGRPYSQKKKANAESHVKDQNVMSFLTTTETPPPTSSS